MKKARLWSTGPAVQKSSATTPCGGSEKFRPCPRRRLKKIHHPPAAQVQQSSLTSPSPPTGGEGWGEGGKLLMVVAVGHLNGPHAINSNGALLSPAVTRPKWWPRCRVRPAHQILVAPAFQPVRHRPEAGATKPYQGGHCHHKKTIPLSGWFLPSRYRLTLRASSLSPLMKKTRPGSSITRASPP